MRTSRTSGKSMGKSTQRCASPVLLSSASLCVQARAWGGGTERYRGVQRGQRGFVAVDRRGGGRARRRSADSGSEKDRERVCTARSTHSCGCLSLASLSVLRGQRKGGPPLDRRRPVRWTGEATASHRCTRLKAVQRKDEEGEEKAEGERTRRFRCAEQPRGRSAVGREE